MISFEAFLCSIFVYTCTVNILNRVVSLGSFSGRHFQGSVLNYSKKSSYTVELIDNLLIDMLLASLAK